ncbi:TPA: hypothetical protein ACGBQD_004936 [Escherichia coli]|uniref:hypothetical protein n=1 Tax=Escherichia coli TaxID=562 RepID=UPI001414AAB0|nr:hypothetical protein [Escherichia coli]MBC1089077.1 hypothetical protein [Escherichia coli]MBS8872344.1 hypothetical protein [Escherichia coli]MDS1619729.1 hypothetical protein [Escherichia coli]MXI40064.1 hypothetical protein [Escherichia coli]
MKKSKKIKTMNHQNNSGIQNQPDYHIEIERKNMVRLLDERIDKVYGSLLGPMKKKNIDKIRHFTLDVMVFILDTNPRVCNKLSREIISLAQNTFIEKNVNFSTFNNEQHKIREYMNEGGGIRWFTWDNPEISFVRASFGLFVKMKTKGDHEHILSDTFLQIVECVNLNIELITKDELVKIINKHFM